MLGPARPRQAKVSDDRMELLMSSRTHERPHAHRLICDGTRISLETGSGMALDDTAQVLLGQAFENRSLQLREIDDVADVKRQSMVDGELRELRTIGVLRTREALQYQRPDPI